VVGVAQLVELLVVVQAVGGSNPLAHPKESPASAGFSLLTRHRRTAPAVEHVQRLNAEPGADASRSQGYSHWALEVEDLDQTFAALSGVGAEPVSPPAPAVQPGARFAYLRDPEGNLLELIQPQAT
jgi:catechol 2,3-dioxygenase-like lactoylglutathione lyase family enzyme